MAPRALYVLMVAGSMMALCYADCAPPEAVYPCTCKGSSMECGHTSSNQLQAAFKAQKEHPGGDNLEMIHLNDYRISFIPNDLFKGLKFKMLKVNTSSLQSFYYNTTRNSALEGVVDTLVELNMNYYGHSVDFDWSSLPNFTRLYNIFLTGSFSAFTVPFPPIPTVVNFWVQHTEATHIAKSAFAGLTGVHYMRMEHNKVPVYSRNMFPRPASNLSIFITLGDDITDLPEDYFDDMPSLSYAQIPPFAHNIPPLNVVGPTNLQGSRGLTCDSRLKWLLRMRDEGKVNILHAICARPQHLYWRDFNSLTEKDL